MTGRPAREDVHGKWLKLHDAARRGPVATSSPTLAEYLTYWLREVVVPPNYAPLTCATYETLSRLYIVPGLVTKRLDKLTLRDVRAWLHKLRDTCQCCAQGKDKRRPSSTGAAARRFRQPAAVVLRPRGQSVMPGLCCVPR